MKLLTEIILSSLLVLLVSAKRQKRQGQQRVATQFFRCNGGVVINALDVCNGRQDCRDCSDEDIAICGGDHLDKSHTHQWYNHTTGEWESHTHAGHHGHDHTHEHMHTHADGTTHSHPHGPSHHPKSQHKPQLSQAHTHADGTRHSHKGGLHPHSHNRDGTIKHIEAHSHTHTHSDGTTHSHSHGPGHHTESQHSAQRTQAHTHTHGEGEHHRDHHENTCILQDPQLNHCGNYWYFHCLNHKCIRRGLICNGVDDCGDGSDEPANCAFKNRN